MRTKVPIGCNVPGYATARYSLRNKGSHAGVSGHAAEREGLGQPGGLVNACEVCKTPETRKETNKVDMNMEESPSPEQGCAQSENDDDKSPWSADRATIHAPSARRLCICQNKQIYHQPSAGRHGLLGGIDYAVCG